MNDSHKLDVIMQRQVMMLELMPLLAGFIAALTHKIPQKEWEKVRKDYLKITKKYETELNEYLNNIASEQTRVS